VLLRIEDLTVEFPTPAGVVRAVERVSLDLAAGRTLALVGESGCGKSVLAAAILRLLPSPGRVVAGRIVFRDRDLLTLSQRELRGLRGDRIGMVFQEPMTSLNPLLPVGQQIDEVLLVHRRWPRRQVRQRTLELLERVRVPEPQRVYHACPHQLSGGMRQRAMIAMALACQPELLIADEPTTALDVTVQVEILALLRELRRAAGLALLLITHDLGVVVGLADEVAIMYAGRIVERLPTVGLADARHPYTRGLLAATAGLNAAGGRPAASGSRRLPMIAGEVPHPLRRPPGCAFNPRCGWADADARCRTVTPPLRAVADGRWCACWQVTG